MLMRIKIGFNLRTFQQLINAIYRASQMGNSYGTANHKRHIESVEKLGPRDADVYALFDVVSDAIVTAQDSRCYEAHQFFRSFVESTVFISLRIKCKETFDSEVTTPS